MTASKKLLPAIQNYTDDGNFGIYRIFHVHYHAQIVIVNTQVNMQSLL